MTRAALVRLPGLAAAGLLILASSALAAPPAGRPAHRAAPPAVHQARLFDSPCPTSNEDSPGVPSTCAPSCTGDQVNNCTDQLQNGGGRVLHDPRVYLIFWGASWPTDPTTTISDIQLMFQSLPGSAFNDVLTVYYDSSGYVRNDGTWAGLYEDTTSPIPSFPIGTADVQQEVRTAEVANGWLSTSDPQLAQDEANAQFIVFLPPGTAIAALYNGDCGVHFPILDANRYQVPAAFIRYPTDDAGNGQTCMLPGLTVPQKMETQVLHEYAESVTDPDGPPLSNVATTWSTVNPVLDPIEVGDKCQGYNGWMGLGFKDQFVTDSTGAQAVLPRLWDITQPATQGCVVIHGHDYPSPDSTSPFAGHHTVKDAILAKYLQIGADGGYFNQPVSEQTPIAGGQVSYFAGSSCGRTAGSPSGSAIYQAPGATTAFGVDGCIYQKYRFNMPGGSNGPGGELGFAVTDELPIMGGQGHVSYFAGQSCSGGFNGAGSGIYNWAGGTFVVQGCIFHEYEANQLGAGGALGFPASDEYQAGALKRSDFQYGYITYDPGSGQVQTHVAVRSSTTLGLASFNNQLFACWVSDNGSVYIGTVSTATGYVSPRPVGQSSYSGCSLAGEGSLLYLAWTGTDGHLNIETSSDGTAWGGRYTFSDTSSSGPALALYPDGLALAWRGTDNRLNLWYSSGGLNFTNKATFGDTASAAPALNGFGGHLYMAWPGTDSGTHLNIAEFGSVPSYACKSTLSNQSLQGPGLTNAGGSLYLEWTGLDSGLNRRSTGGGCGLGVKVTTGNTASTGPAVSGFGGTLWVAWADTSGVLNARALA